MGFWIFMMVMDCLIPLTMIGFGRYFRKSAPGEINGVFGYRTAMSMKNKDTWEFAHRYCGKLWHGFGLGLLIVSAAVMVLVMGRSQDTVGMTGGLLCIVQLVFLIGAIFPTEIALRKTFDQNGLRRK